MHVIRNSQKSQKMRSKTDIKLENLHAKISIDI